MDTKATLRYTFARLMNGLSCEPLVAEIVATGTSEEWAHGVVSRAVAIMRDAQVRDILASSLEGRNKLETEIAEALVSSGIERECAEALAEEVVARRDGLQAKKDASDREADLIERKFHQNLALKFVTTGMGCICLGAYLVVDAPELPRHVGFVLCLLFGVFAIFFFKKAWDHIAGVPSRAQGRK
jgi:hypothetical protein